MRRNRATIAGAAGASSPFSVEIPGGPTAYATFPRRPSNRAPGSTPPASGFNPHHTFGPTVPCLMAIEDLSFMEPLASNSD